MPSPPDEPAQRLLRHRLRVTAQRRAILAAFAGGQIVIPCHRVIRGPGELVGYSGGVERKRARLALEGAPVERGPP